MKCKLQTKLEKLIERIVQEMQETEDARPSR